MAEFDFSSISDLGKFWDGSKDKKWGGGMDRFNTYSSDTLAGRYGNLDTLYQNLIGRNADPGGKKYWGDKIAANEATYADVANAVKASGEYTDQQDYIANNPNATAADLKSLDSAYVSPFHKDSGSAAAGWKPGDALTLAMARAMATTESNPDGSQKLDADGNYIVKDSYDDQTNKTVGDIRKNLTIIGGVGGEDDNVTTGGGTNTVTYTQNPYDDSFLRSELAGLRSAFDAYKDDMSKMWANANWDWGSGYGAGGQTVSGVKTQNELPGFKAKTGGSSGFFGRGGNRFGLTTSSLNI